MDTPDRKTAEELVRQFGTQSADVALRRADMVGDTGNYEGWAYWTRVAEIVDQLGASPAE